MGILPHKYGSNIPPEVADELDKIVGEMVAKVEPEMQRVALLLKQHGIPGSSIELIMGVINPEKLFGFPFRPDPSMPPGEFRFTPPLPKSVPTPANDLVGGITQILNHEFGEDRQEILGMIYDKNRNVAFEIAKILEAARKRDQRSLARELENIIKKLQ